jgi:Ca2+-binding EF-hand superfamily protein
MYHSRTIISTTDADDGKLKAQTLASTILSLCNESKRSFEDPDFGPILTADGEELEVDINTALKKKLSATSFQTIQKTFKRAQSNRTKCLHSIHGLSAKPIDPSNLVWKSNDVETSTIVSDHATPSYPIQGSVGDSWLLGAMSMVAITRPKLLQEIFICPTRSSWNSINKQSRYGTIPVSNRDVYIVRLFHELRWHYVIIDGRVPRFPSDDRPLFGRCSDVNEIWVPLLEKAAAKLVGGYEKLHQAGTVDFGLHMLTGCSTHTIRGGGFQGNEITLQGEKKYNLEDQQQLVTGETSKADRAPLYKQISQFVNAGFAVGCERRQRAGTVKNLSFKSPSALATFTDNDGMLIRHTYVVVDVGEVRGTKLVRLVNPWMINPWPTGQYNGAWSRNSEEFKENKSSVLKLFKERVRRNVHTDEMMQYVPSYTNGGENNESEGEVKEEGKGSDAEEQEEGNVGEAKTPVDFIMTFDTFVETMSHIHIGFIPPLDESSWTICSVKGKWSARVGGCASPGHDLNKWSKNPRYNMSVPEENVSVAELERRKRSQVNKKTSVTTVVVSVRQSVKPSQITIDREPAILGLRFVPTGQSNVPTLIQNTIPGRSQPYHVAGSGSVSVSLNVRTSTSMDVVPDNYRVGAIADFVMTVVSYKSCVELKNSRPKESGENKQTASKVGIVVDRDASGDGSITHDRYTIPDDRIPRSHFNVMRGIRKIREEYFSRIVHLEKKRDEEREEMGESFNGGGSSSDGGGGDSKMKTSISSSKISYEPPEVMFEKSLDFWSNKHSSSNSNLNRLVNNSSENNRDGDGNSGLPSYQNIVKQKAMNARGGGELFDGEGAAGDETLPPPPPYTRIVVSPERAALREKIHQTLWESPPKKGSKNEPYFGAVVDVDEDNHCAVVYRGGLLMPTIDMSPSSKLNGTSDIRTNAFILCTVQEIVHPYALIFSVEHPGTRTSATRKFELKHLEAMLTAPLSKSSTMTANKEAVAAVDKWFETGVLPKHDHLVTWLSSKMELDLGGGGLHVEAIDGPLDHGDDDDDDLVDELEKIEFHDVEGAEEASVASSWEDEEDEKDDLNNDTMKNGGDENAAPDEWADGDAKFGSNGSGDQNIPDINAVEPQREVSSGARLPDSDPFVLASLHAGAVLKELQEKDEYRKRVAKVREEVILQRSRRLRAASEYTRDVSRLQHEEIGKAIMRQTVAVGVASSLKKADVQDERRKRQLSKLTNPFKHNPSEKWIKGPNLGEGPLPSRAIDLPRRQKRIARERSKYAYDSHGRCIPKKMLGNDQSGPAIEIALNKMRQTASGKGFMDIKDLFDSYDANKNGYLSIKELKLAIKSLNIKMTNDEENELIKHFDANNNGSVHFAEFSFAFFNRRSLISKWKLIRGPGMRTEHAIMSMFRKYDYDGSGKLEKDEFERCLNDMGICLSPLEFQILAEKFDTNHDGYVQPVEFVEFMKELSLADAKQRKEHRDTVTNALLNEIRSDAAAGALSKGSNVHPTIKALRAKIKAQEEEMERLERFMARRK